MEVAEEFGYTKSVHTDCKKSQQMHTKMQGKQMTHHSCHMMQELP
jgi:hypothetical protein